MPAWTVPVVRNGLRAYWPMQAHSSGLLVDCKGGHNGTRSGTVHGWHGVYGPFLTFDGVDDHVEVPASDDFSGVPEFTCVAMVRPNRVDETQQIAGFGGASADRNWQLKIHDTGQVRVRISDGTNAQAHDSGLQPTAGAWQLIGMRYVEGVELTAILNTETATVSPAFDLAYTAKVLQIGSRSGGSAQQWDGDMAFLAMYDRALSRAELQALVDWHVLGSVTRVGGVVS